ncbi:MAG TPA: haloacid dehalogenase type II [Pseudonocardiaceae bacterium]|jgi:2-haloacid dehalogenase|nr:haloacid dehalogenase type II [Pseudonocardiaceae bacterium]
MSFLSPTTGRSVRAVLFDTFGTVVDWRGGITAAATALFRRHGIDTDGAAFADAWRDLYQPSMTPIRDGVREFVTLDVLHGESVRSLLADRGLSGAFAESEIDALVHAWHELPPWPDSVAGLTAVKAHYVIGPLSNGNTSLLTDLAKHSGLPWDVILGSDVRKAYKPTRAAYLAPAELLDLAPGEIMLAAAHNDDLRHARSFGLATGFIARPTEGGPEQTADLVPDDDWDVSVASIVELAKAIGPH